MREARRKPTVNGIPAAIPRVSTCAPGKGARWGTRPNVGEWRRGGILARDGADSEGEGKEGMMDVDEGEESGRSAQLLSEESAAAE